MEVPLSFELRMAWREIKPAARRFALMIAAIALGVGALTGIKGFSQALSRAMSRSARELIAADLTARFTTIPKPDQMKALNSLERSGAAMTQVTETLSMASSSNAPAPLLSTVRAVDPAFYPFYGKVELDPEGDLSKVLTDDSAVVSQDFLIRSRTAAGEMMSLGSARFRIAAVLKSEPDRIASGLELGPRIIITRHGLDRTKLMQFGSRAVELFLFRLSPSLPLERARASLESALGRSARISDYRNPNPSISRGLDRMANFLSLIGLLALLVGGLGVATTIHSYLQQKLDSIAIIKCLGGRSWQIIRIYLIQGLLLGTVGSVLGVAVGYGIQVFFPRMIRGLIDLPTSLEPAPGAAAQGFLIGVVTTLVFLLPPLLAVRQIRPARVFLREMPESVEPLLRRLRNNPLPIAASALLVAVVGLLAGWLADSIVRGLVFMAGLAGAILSLAAVARLLLLGLRRLPRMSSLTLRHGLKNLYRPGSHVTSVLVAMGLGVGFILVVYLVQTSLIPQVVKSAPRDFPNVFVLGITERDKARMWDFFKAQPGIIDAGNPIPNIPSRLLSVDGRNPESLAQHGLEGHAHVDYVLTWSESIPPDTRIVRGQWWQKPYRPSLISVADHAARDFNIGPGAVLEFESSGIIVKGTVVNVREADFSRPGNNNQFIFSPGSLDKLPSSYVGGLRVSTSSVAPLQAAIFDRFPNTTSVDVGQFLSRIQSILDRISTVIRFVAAFAIVAGVIILASSIASTRYQRIREAVLLKTLGATRRQIARIHAAEFLIIGLSAGLIGSLLAAAAANYMLGHLLETQFNFQWLPLVVGTFGTSALAIATGWLASRGVLRHRPLEVLRENQ